MMGRGESGVTAKRRPPWVSMTLPVSGGSTRPTASAPSGATAEKLLCADIDASLEFNGVDCVIFAWNNGDGSDPIAQARDRCNVEVKSHVGSSDAPVSWCATCSTWAVSLTTQASVSVTAISSGK